VPVEPVRAHGQHLGGLLCIQQPVGVLVGSAGRLDLLPDNLPELRHGEREGGGLRRGRFGRWLVHGGLIVRGAGKALAAHTALGNDVLGGDVRVGRFGQPVA
jgi:hypothetical protein